MARGEIRAGGGRVREILQRLGFPAPHAIKPGPDPQASGMLEAWARLPADELLRQIGTSPDGLTETEAAARLLRNGPNLIAREAQQTIPQELAGRAKNPLNALLLSLAAVSWFTGDARAAIVICVMVILSVTLAFLQEHRSNQAATKLRAMVKTRASVHRPTPGGAARVLEIPVDQLVPGDVVQMAAGDLVPADLRLLACKTLHVNQSALTGEAMPVDKAEAIPAVGEENPFDFENLCFMGSNVLSGTATGVILQTGTSTYFG